MTQAENIKIPTLYELKAIQPVSSSPADETLSYDNLGPAVAEHRSYEFARQNEFFEAEPGSTKEILKARGLARLYMVMSAHRLNHEAYTDMSKQLWSERYTQAAIELYGQPNQELAIATGSQRAQNWIKKAEVRGVDSTLIERYRSLTTQYGIDISSSHEQRDFSEIAAKVGDYMNERYGSVFEALGFGEEERLINPEEFAKGVRQGLDALAENHDEDWANWKVELDENSDKITAFAQSQKLVVGLARTPMTANKAKGLFAHEILVHGLRGLNGKKISIELQKGLPGYIDAEEGMGVFMDYAVTGNLPDSADKYVDIAMALGMIDGTKRTRQEMIELVSVRMAIKNELEADSEKQTDQQVVNKATAHVNRIYRGSLGNEFVGVFTKDIVYFKGFLDMAVYIEQEIAAGKNIHEIIEYIMQFKFDPTNDQHANELERLKHEKQS